MPRTCGSYVALPSVHSALALESCARHYPTYVVPTPSWKRSRGPPLRRRSRVVKSRTTRWLPKLILQPARTHDTLFAAVFIPDVDGEPNARRVTNPQH